MRGSWGPFLLVLVTRAPLFLVYIRAPNFWKRPYDHIAVSTNWESSLWGVLLIRPLLFWDRYPPLRCSECNGCAAEYERPNNLNEA